MASEFIGYTILVTLKSPPWWPNSQVQGVVANVANQKLFLRDVLLLWNRQRLDAYTLDSSSIADLEVSPAHPQPPRAQKEELATTSIPVTVAATQPQPENSPIPLGHASVTPKQQNASDATTAFVDPAIVSYAKPPAVGDAGAARPQPVSPIMIADGIVSSPSARLMQDGNVGSSSVSSIATAVPRHPHSAKNTSASATLTEPFDALRLGKSAVEAKVAPAPAPAPPTATTTTAPPKTRDTPSQTGPGIIDMKDVNHGPLSTAAQRKAAAGKGKGWRQTPLIEEVPRSNKKKNTQRGRRAAVEDVNGWATEDATDIQDMGEFDFESNLSKFDKRRVFDDIRQADTTAEADRLVSFNRKARPGTNGGRNLHYTENVLDMPDTKDKDRWKSEAGETEDETMEGHYSSGKGSRRAGSRRPLQSRKASGIPGHLEQTESPRTMGNRIQTASPLNGSVSGLRASFKMASNKPCHCLSPLQMLEIEQLCTSELGLTEDMLSENAGRSIAMAVLKVSPTVKSVVFLVGNHKSGARAIAAARHLRNRRLRVTVVVLGGEREELLLEAMRKQLNVYKKGQGYVDRWDEYQAKASSGGPSPDVVVDALLGVHVTFEELRTDDQATVLEMIRWANRSSSVLSIDVPTGLSATSGLLTEVDGQALVMASKHVLSLGAPKTGLLLAMATEGFEHSWNVWVADIGISAAAWQKYGTRRQHGTDFGTEWIVPVKFVVGSQG
ncbi:enhancer of mRNA decapping [Exophiala dermatitidis]|uniref:Enhancer of mRNA-decapping protein 3 n=1 Tax=Exophiala dermatitidis TaxID=5970 RepID=A0AAN6ERR3_EXODE|nr:enhancer of mRNA decapping [Exophiala dermatitidis]KAJ4507781.1 enhancer of mRNA decapping [Exophiala dermatitidis]KAJ4509920.1 enhancer of mRNA decapping [Exophiala dermatitidis]KAJ4539525.1 enhancer of mRNA decapping [Exophiala dermatitidis]KAJ4542696.1 enhancer of mRNA decapping [Exophiala dermatitidis]